MICKLYCKTTKFKLLFRKEGFLITISPNCLFTLRELQIISLLYLPEELSYFGLGQRFRGFTHCSPEVVLDEKCGIEFADGDLVVV